MKIFITAIFLFITICLKGQMQVMCDSVISIKGTSAYLRGHKITSDSTIYFVYHWIGGISTPKPAMFLYYLFTIYDRPQGRRKILVTKNKPL